MKEEYLRIDRKSSIDYRASYKDENRMKSKDLAEQTWFEADITPINIKYFFCGEDFYMFNDIDLEDLIDFKRYCENLQIEMRLA